MTASTFNWSCNQTWKRSGKNTAWCLLGCAVGDFGTILFFQLTKIPFPVLGIMTLAIINGLITSVILETISEEAINNAIKILSPRTLREAASAHNIRRVTDCYAAEVVIKTWIGKYKGYSA